MNASGQTEAPTQPLFRDALCAVDGTPGGFDSVEQAASLTGPAGHLTLLEVTSSREESGHPVTSVGPLRAKEILDRAVGIAAEAQIRPVVEVDPAAPPAKVILEWASEHDLLAMGPPSSSWFAGMFTHSATVAALGQLPTPLLVARPQQAGDDIARHVLVASDGREGSDELVAFAARLAQPRGASVTLVHAHGDAEAREERVHEQAARLQEQLGPAAAVLVRDGHAHTELLSAAEEVGATVVLMGSRRLEGLRAIGSVSRRVVHAAPCSVLLMTPESLAAD